jgi:hypothetical protein
MPLKLHPLGFGIDKDRQDYTVYTGEWSSVASTKIAAPRASTLVLVAVLPQQVRQHLPRLAERVSAFPNGGSSRGANPMRDATAI